MNVFAGFWVDGAVRKPEATHADVTNMVFVLWKDRKEFDLVNGQLFSKFEGVYWLDTTPRESLTPEEALSVIQVIYPQYTTIEKYEHNNWKFYGIDYHMPIDWGGLTQYPPPVEPQWIRITRDNVGQYLFQSCRASLLNQSEWWYGSIVGWDIEDNCCLVDTMNSKSERVLKWDIVEVQNVN